MIAIAKTKAGFTPRWVEYCEKSGISYIFLDPYQNNFIEQLLTSSCDVFLWHHNHGNYKDLIFAKQLLYSVEAMGIKVFPNFHTNWHFDDKLGQKYLLEAIGAPIVPTFVFYTKEEARKWISQTIFPKVFKLRNGAGASNVVLIKNEIQAKRIIRQAFRGGFKTNYWGLAMDNAKKFLAGKAQLRDILKYLALCFFPYRYNSGLFPAQKGYLYFQEFIPNNSFDIRVIVIGERAFAIKRMTRKGDFRASGSGQIVYAPEEIVVECLKISFDVTEKIGGQCIAFDYVFDGSGKPLIVELSFGFTPAGYDPCPGYWDKSLNFYEGPFNPYSWMIESLK